MTFYWLEEIVEFFNGINAFFGELQEKDKVLTIMQLRRFKFRPHLRR